MTKAPNSDQTNESIKPWSAGQERFGKWFIKRIGKWQTFVYELTGGRLWSRFLGVECAILTTTGRKSGAARKTPLLYLAQGDEVVMVASQGGMSSMPLWYRNLQATPEAVVQVGRDQRQMTARDANEQERAALWPQLDALYPGYQEYRARTDGVREIPIVIFTPRV
ncbi:Deazaflavin-dependent nitroreductase [Sinobacterium norvegicum]|uniref:Deazaflavin-dependent nitroreductase n=1 Tax=Sinobacterium norvegicum TaxID=1641715 RepID=A0ABN8EHM9_9GAMM|nr:nitroreductase family deazaflavin-dependent oxidoreductase [Sinobacterium norvegicum]CAH0991953.1 Deazaflavin-dependent nitroreductase [Sinobacterium norvegicum]